MPSHRLTFLVTVMAVVVHLVRTEPPRRGRSWRSSCTSFAGIVGFAATLVAMSMAMLRRSGEVYDVRGRGARWLLPEPGVLEGDGDRQLRPPVALVVGGGG